MKSFNLVLTGNGDIAANVRTEQNGDIVMLMAKSDVSPESRAKHVEIWKEATK